MLNSGFVVWTDVAASNDERDFSEEPNTLFKFEPFLAPDGEAYISVLIGGRRETMKLKSPQARLLISRRVRERLGRVPRKAEMNAALAELRYRADDCDVRHPVHLRAAVHDGRYYVDLADRPRRVVEIDANSWRIINDPPVRFVRPPGMFELPTPERSGSLGLLKKYVNVGDDDTFILLVSWILAALRGVGPYPVLVLKGEQGAAKSTSSRIIRSIIDPNVSPIRSIPRGEQELMVSAMAGHVLAFDNVSTISAPMSDAFCRMSTGAGFATRRVYSDDDEVIFQASRPIILNGIGDLIERPDLSERSIEIVLTSIDARQRQTEEELWRQFEHDRPAILGGLFDAMQIGLKNFPATTVDRYPRMADFAKWATACEPGFAPPGAVLAAYDRTRAEADVDLIEDDPIAAAVRRLVPRCGEWAGTASELLDALRPHLNLNDRRLRSLTASLLSNRLTRLALALRTAGIIITRDRRGKKRTRIIEIRSDEKADAADEADGE